MKTERSQILLALGSLYVIWGSTFLGIRIALEGFPPLLLAGLRYAIAGVVTYAWVRARGARPPTRTEWRSSLIVGTLLVSGNACVVVAEQWVSSGVAAVAIASVPLWVALVAGLFGRWPSRGEWLGLAVGLAGVAILQTGGDMRANPAGAIVLTAAAFGLVHYPGFGWARVVATGCVGLLLGWVRWRTGNTGVAIVAHATMNIVGAALLTMIILLS